MAIYARTTGTITASLQVQPVSLNVAVVGMIVCHRANDLVFFAMKI